MNAALRNRYHDDGVSAVSQERLLLALYDRLLADLDHAASAIDERRPADAHGRLVHAQQIIEELHLALDQEAWPEGGRLASVYLYALDRLVQANLRKDAAPVREVAAILAPLAATWREAYERISTPASSLVGATGTTGPAPVQASARGFDVGA